LRKARSLKAVSIWILILTIVFPAVYFTFESMRKADERQRHGNDAYGLTTKELASLSRQAENGDSKAAYKVGRHHMYVSLDYLKAEKYFRLAAISPNVDAKLALITVLRGQQHDIEVDLILLSLKELDEQAWHDASEEVARIRTSRHRQ
jgi:TPR repeat protein